jgi:hypothetical protein
MSYTSEPCSLVFMWLSGPILIYQHTSKPYAELPSSEIPKSIRYPCPYSRYPLARSRPRYRYHTVRANHWSPAGSSEVDNETILPASSGICSGSCIRQSTWNRIGFGGDKSYIYFHVCQSVPGAIRVSYLKSHKEERAD